MIGNEMNLTWLRFSMIRDGNCGKLLSVNLSVGFRSIVFLGFFLSRSILL